MLWLGFRVTVSVVPDGMEHPHVGAELRCAVNMVTHCWG